MLTVAEMARNIGIPATTAREYVGRFKEFFPTKKVSGKRYPMHPESAELIMRDIVDLYARHKTTDDVTNLLKEKYPMDADIVDEDSESHGNKSSKTSSPSTKNESNALEVISRMSTMQMQLMQKMTEVLDRNNQVMERVIDALDKNPSNGHGRRQAQLPETSTHGKERLPNEPIHADREHSEFDEQEESMVTEQKTPIPPKKFIMPSKEDMEKRKSKGGLFSKIFGG